MNSAAYEMNPARKPDRRTPSVQVVRGGRYGLNKAKKMARTAVSLLVCALMLGMVVSVVQSQAKITALSGEIESTRRDLTAAQSDYDYLYTTMSNITNQSSVEEVAVGSLGLVKADSSQITYIQLEEESVITKASSEAAKLLDSVRTAALSLIGTLDP